MLAGCMPETEGFDTGLRYVREPVDTSESVESGSHGVHGERAHPTM